MKFFMILSHLCIVLSISFLAFAVLDWYNPMMNFTNNFITSKMLLLFCLISLILSIRQARLAQGHKKKRRKST